MKPVPVEVIHNQAVTPVIYRMGLKPLEPLAHAAAGQFYMVRTSPGLDPLLRRPLGHFGYCRAPAPKPSPPEAAPALEILYQVVGRGTELLSRMKPGHTTDLIGPLGRGWLPEPAAERLILVAGGMGIVPLWGLANELRAQGDRRPIYLIWGAGTAKEIFCEEELEKLDMKIFLVIEDAIHGLGNHLPSVFVYATDLLKKILDQTPDETIVDVNKENVVKMEKLPLFACETDGTLVTYRKPKVVKKEKFAIFACGPWAMLKEVAEVATVARKRKIPCQVSLDEFMACGLGACLTCVVRGRDGHNLRVCKEGPVFRAEEIDWNAR